MGTRSLDEAYTAEILTSVSQVEQKIAVLGESLSDVTHATTQQLEIQTSRLVTAARELETKIQVFTATVQEQVNESAAAAAATTHANLHQWVLRTTQEAVQQAAQQELAQMLTTLRQSSARLEYDLGHAARHVRNASGYVTWNVLTQVALAFAGAVVGGLVVWIAATVLAA